MEQWKRDLALKVIFCFATLHLCSVTVAQDFLLPPPLLHFDRSWDIPEDEPVGTRVSQVKTSEPSDGLEFSIESSTHLDGSSFFRIDSKSGAIYLKKSMQGKKGSQFFLKIVAMMKGRLPSKTEVRVRVIGSSATPDGHLSIRLNRPGNNEGPVAYDGRPVGNIPYFPSVLTFPHQPSMPPMPVSTSTSSPVTPETEEKTKPPILLEPNNEIPEVSSEFSLQPQPPTPSSPSNEINAYEIVANETEEPRHELPSNEISEISNLKQTVLSNGTKAGDASNNIVIFTIVPIVLIFGVVPIVAASVWLVRRRTRVKKRPTKEMRKESAATTTSSLTLSGEGLSASSLREWIKQAQSNRYESWNPESENAKPPNRWEFPRHHLQVGRILGEGCFGQVWQCEALNIDGKEGVTTVAVKTLKEGAGEREREDLLSELAVMKMLDPHPHVVRLLGACTEKSPIFLIMEYVALGKLQSFLRNSRSSHYYPNLHGDSNSLSSKDLTAFCYQVARGMEYLSSKGIIHRDLAARNILIDKEHVCKVADFGFARDVVANHVYERKTDGRLPVRWMAPEALYDNIFTTKTDIWSFGVLMWEIITLGSTPYPGISAAEVMRKVREGYRLEKPEHCKRELYNIMYYCWAQNPDDRPTFSDLVTFLKHLLFSETDYIELDRFPDRDYYNYMPNQTSGEKL